MGVLTYCLAGEAFVLIGAWEAFVSVYAHLNSSASSLSSPPDRSYSTTTTTKTTSRKIKKSLSFSFIAGAAFSFVFILNSLVSLLNAIRRNDRVGLAIQLEIAAIASLFLLYSVVGFFVDYTDSISLPSSLLSLISLFAFGQEFLHFYLQRKDPSGIENRYFDLLLLPIGVCFLSSILELAWPKSVLPSLVRGVALVLQGTWFFQMGFSFFTDFMVHGCALHERSRANYTVKCKGHPEYHRGRAIATLQFNCHLAFLVILVVVLYSFLAGKYGIRGDYTAYKPINVELQKMYHHPRFTLYSDCDEDDEIKEEQKAEKQESLVILG
ncbi:uncharacterized protein LOC122654179 [Telopea speciosissima]|uniref:uncharacterized protein LOC122654179 n=1 Tax=Telopea speciosissima TaxID=54955 RepID=UPI001CC7F868|nr:uncharacterized protein LOC122654179 [Telopea speciosissima]